MGPRLSILIPTRDRLDFLKLSLASAREQSMEDVEILVSDDGSTDATVEYVRGISATDPRVRLLTGNPAPGAFENIWYLVGHASAGAIVVLGDDDVLLPLFSERLVPALEDSTVNVAYGQFEVIAGDGQPLPRRTAELYRHHRYASTPRGRSADGVGAALAGQLWLGSCVYRTDVIRQLGFDATFGSAADWDLALRATGGGASFFVPEVLWFYRDHAGTISQGTAARVTASAIAVLEAHRAPTVENEALRLDLLRALLATQAWKSVVTDPERAIESIQRFDSLGGHRLEPRRFLTRLLLMLSPGLRTRLHGALVAAVSQSRLLRP